MDWRLPIGFLCSILPGLGSAIYSVTDPETEEEPVPKAAKESPEPASWLPVTSESVCELEMVVEPVQGEVAVGV